MIGLSPHFLRPLIIATALFSWTQANAQTEEKKDGEENQKPKRTNGAEINPDEICGRMNSSDGQRRNQKQGISLKLGPPGFQFGHSNPLGIPPGIQDLSITYVWRCGHEFNTEIVPGPTFGFRYRKGPNLYGSYGAGYLITANGMGPGVYTAIGASFSRQWPFTVEVEFKQGFGFSVGEEKNHIITPYAFRVGAGYWW